MTTHARTNGSDVPSWAGELDIERRHLVTLGEGHTPTVEASDLLGSTSNVRLWLKCEHLNPTGSFKDRIAAVAASLARSRGLRGLLGTSSGNGGAAAAAYGAAAGLHTHMLAVRGAPASKLVQIRAVGATVQLVDGLGTDAGATERVAAWVLDEADRVGFLPFLTGRRYAPDIMMGARSIALELAEQHPAATHVYAPVGGGGLVAALWAGYLAAGGESVPRVVAVQPAGCPTVRAALGGGPPRLGQPSTTEISGLQVAAMFDDVVPAINDSGGHLTEVTDSEVYAAQRRLATRGMLVEPAGATALAGLLADVERGRLPAGAQAVALLTGAGWKDAAALAALAERAAAAATFELALPAWMGSGRTGVG
ncbi:pyridoxal-phosphate dependent enzyme [Desertimonas flava]|uniref:pyridoxal-phosphate dependent enzyme n=1 Tax=Desertimonas flava TaxID=2064846 RepID=UPI0013C46788|nr:pyridoxal-phosphate dependent enzyme [Desertimonas flava]